jgi:hypothetical protein
VVEIRFKLSAINTVVELRPLVGPGIPAVIKELAQRTAIQGRFPGRSGRTREPYGEDSRDRNSRHHDSQLRAISHGQKWICDEAIPTIVAL